ncbi:MAG: tetratricopeptide repeat protein [Pseudomonadota bacterium]
MTRFRYIAVACALAAPVAAQSPYPQSYPSSVYTPLAPQTDADRLAAQMRTLAANPTDLYALVGAAQLSLKLGDTDGAAALYARAERLDARNPQVKAGLARLLVQTERPGEALRTFQEAQQLGASERDFGPDRALAYDLIGEQERAQRDYRAQLRLGSDDETVRRYALSLGISGLQEPALALLEPLNRRSDRGAWRVRAFVLAMNGDRAGAEQIATTMMPPGMAQGLAPFFDRLPRLAPVDRAFAVHFGQVRAGPARAADARRTPPLPALSPEPNPFPPKRSAVQVAALEVGQQRRSRNRRREAPAVVAAPYVAPLPAPPRPTAQQLASLSANVLPAPIDAYRPREAGIGTIARGPTILRAPADAYVARANPVVASAVPLLSAPAVGADEDGPDERVGAPPPPATALAAAAIPFAVPVPPPSVITLPGAGSAVGEGNTNSAAAQIVTATVPVPAPAPVAPPVTGLAAASGSIGAPPPPTGLAGDSVLAAIVAAIEVPAAELAARPAALPPGKAKLLTAVEKRAEAKALKDKADAKAKADAKKKPDPAKLEPARIWVQVAGGANEASLGKEWARVVAKAPATFKGKPGWTTPLRATNRVLTGPFKTEAEALALVNTLRKQGLATFMFTSDPGQVVTRLAGK